MSNPRLLAPALALALSMILVRSGDQRTNPAELTRTQAANSGSPDSNLPEPFARTIKDRAVIDGYQLRHHRVLVGATPEPQTSVTIRNSAGRGVRVIHAELSSEIARSRHLFTNHSIPPRSFRAPILERAGDLPDDSSRTNRSGGATQAAADCVTRHLAGDGLVPTLVEVIKILGPKTFLTNPREGIQRLKFIGFPADLLACFKMYEPAGAGKPGPEDLVAYVAGALSRSEPLALEYVSFHFVRANPSFQVATESGEHELGLLRLQAGGGYLDGITPGGSIDVISQLISALPNVDFLISVPNEVLSPFHKLASLAFRLRRSDQLTLIGEAAAVTPWAQDNGKAGFIVDETTGQPRHATLTPRYASVGEGHSAFVPGDSFLMDGLKATGHTVAHSSLLFQGGNLLPVRDPKSGDRILLIGEGELYRNLALGLTREQILEAFRSEFQVDHCVLLPAVSYHLDYDVSVRTQAGELIAFVNDTEAAVRIVLELGLQTLERHGVLDRESARRAKVELAENREVELIQRLTKSLSPLLADQTGGRTALANAFVAGKMDWGGGNLQTFLLALDLLESSIVREETTMSSERVEYLRALQRFETARRRQADELRKIGWRVVAIPSMPDLFRSINYLNGIHHRDGYIMPAFGGFYGPLDQAAARHFQQTLGAALKITPIQSAESQRTLGGVHCTAAAYPRL